MAKSMARIKDNINRTFFKSDNFPEFDGDDKLQRQYFECEEINNGLVLISKTIQSTQVEKASADTSDIDKKFESFKGRNNQKYSTSKIAQSLLAAASKLSPDAPVGASSPGEIYTNLSSSDQASLKFNNTDQENAALSNHPISEMFREIAKEMECLAKQQFIAESDVNATVITGFTNKYYSYEELNNALKQLQKHVVDMQTSDRNLEDAKMKMGKLETSHENFAQLQNKLQAKIDNAEKTHSSNCERVAKERSVLSESVARFVKSQTDIADSMIQYVKVYKNYHEHCSHILSRLLPQLEKYKERLSLTPPFSASLEDHLKETEREIALPIELCTSWLYNNKVLTDPGIFRVGGNIKNVRLLQDKIDRYQATEEDFCEATTLTTLLKSYLRALPESLFTNTGLAQLKAAHEKFSKKSSNDSSVVKEYKEIINRLPKANRDNLKQIFAILHEVLQHEAENKMTSENIGTCIGPSFDGKPVKTLLPSNFSALDLPEQTCNFIVAQLVRNAKFVFDLNQSPVVFRSIKEILESPPIPGMKSADDRPTSPSRMNQKPAPHNSLKAFRHSSPTKASIAPHPDVHDHRLLSVPEAFPRNGHVRSHSNEKVLTPSKNTRRSVDQGMKKKTAPNVPSPAGHRPRGFIGSCIPPTDTGIVYEDNVSSKSSGNWGSVENLISDSNPQQHGSKTYAFSSQSRKPTDSSNTSSNPQPAPRSFRAARPTVPPPAPPGSSNVQSDANNGRENKPSDKSSLDELLEDPEVDLGSTYL